MFLFRAATATAAAGSAAAWWWHRLSNLSMRSQPLLLLLLQLSVDLWLLAPFHKCDHSHETSGARPGVGYVRIKYEVLVIDLRRLPECNFCFHMLNSFFFFFKNTESADICCSCCQDNCCWISPNNTCTMTFTKDNIILSEAATEHWTTQSNS